MRVVEQPKHGRINIENGTGFSTYPENNQRYECNKRKTDGVVISYKPDSGFLGSDSVSMDLIFPGGAYGKRHYSIDVR